MNKKKCIIYSLDICVKSSIINTEYLTRKVGSIFGWTLTPCLSCNCFEIHPCSLLKPLIRILFRVSRTYGEANSVAYCIFSLDVEFFFQFTWFWERSRCFSNNGNEFLNYYFHLFSLYIFFIFAFLYFFHLRFFFFFGFAIIVSRLFLRNKVSYIS